MVDNLEAQNRIDKINTYCVSVPDDTKHNMYLLYCFCLTMLSKKSPTSKVGDELRPL